MTYSNEVQSILRKGYIQINDFFTEQELYELFEYAKNEDEIKNADIIRNFSHPVYRLAVGKKVQDLLLGIARERVTALPGISKNKDLISPENISISFGRKGPTYKNSARAKDGFHYDDSFVNAVLTFSLPEKAQGNGLFIYKNLKSNLGMGFVAKVVSRLLGRVSFLRFVFKPAFIPYKIPYQAFC